MKKIEKILKREMKEATDQQLYDHTGISHPNQFVLIAIPNGFGYSTRRFYTLVQVDPDVFMAVTLDGIDFNRVDGKRLKGREAWWYILKNESYKCDSLMDMAQLIKKLDINRY